MVLAGVGGSGRGTGVTAMRVPRRWGPLLLVLALLPGVRAAEALPTGSLPPFCGLAPDANLWQGAGVVAGRTDEWEDPQNWSTGIPPTQPGADPDVCVPSGGVARVDPGEEEHLTTLDVDAGARVVVAQGGKLFTYGSQGAGQDSVVRSGGRLEVLSGTYGGTARLHVLGTLVLRNTGLGAATVLTRDCAYDSTPGGSYPGEEDCDPPATPPAGPTGVIEVDDPGVVDVLGGRVNLGDGYLVVVRGLVRVRSGAYAAADHGTGLELRPHRTAAPGTGTLRFEGDGGFLEGRTTADTGIPTLSTLVNQGRIDKVAGAGRTLVAADYRQYSQGPTLGRVSVGSGTLLVPKSQMVLATVQGGATYGTGRCVDATAPDCPTTTNDNFRQSAELLVPGFDASGARVRVHQWDEENFRRDLGTPFDVHAAGLDADADHPAVIRLRYDATVLRGKGWSDVQIYRKSLAEPYALVAACTGAGTPPAGQVACVDRNGTSTSSRDLAGGDVLMVVRAGETTPPTPTGTTPTRWVAR